MPKDLVVLPRLYDTYGALLTERQRELFELYYEQDLSLSEISEIAGITRQGARDAIGHAETALREFEEKLGLFHRTQAAEAARARVLKAAAELDVINRTGFKNPRAERLIAEMRDAASALSETWAQDARAQSTKA
ncbi:MAG: sigma factor-like helix-turn-helix DNA-binding protein [Clostridiaceae bacterium]|nr:sigma factor-like helix-turn-helix DNA-binding protein [Clostridiaceae bacterium]